MNFDCGLFFKTKFEIIFIKEGDNILKLNSLEMFYNRGYSWTVAADEKVCVIILEQFESLNVQRILCTKTNR